MVDGELAEVTPFAIDPSLAQHLHQVTDRAPHVEGGGHREVPPQQPSGNVGVGGDPVVAGIARPTLAVAISVTALTKIGPAVSIWHPGGTGLGYGCGPLGGGGELSAATGQHRPHTTVPRG